MSLHGVPILPLEPGSDAWLKTMSASKIAAVVGLSPYESRFSLWHKMAGLVGRDEGTAATARGHYLEDGIARWFADQHPGWGITAGGCWAHPDEPLFTASPDRMLTADGSIRLLEVKTAADSGEWGEPGTDQIPVGYKAQVQWQMFVTGAEITHVAVLTAFLDLREYVVEADLADQELLAGAARAFMASLPGGPNEQRPDLDAHGATYEAVKALHSEIEDRDVEVPADLARDFCDTRRELTALKKYDQMLTTQLADLMGDAQRATFAGQTIARRQAKGDKPPYVVAGRNLPTFDDLEQTA